MSQNTASRIVLSTMLTLAIVVVISEGWLNDFHDFVIEKITKGEGDSSPSTPGASGASGLEQGPNGSPGPGASSGSGIGGGGGRSW